MPVMNIAMQAILFFKGNSCISKAFAKRSFDFLYSYKIYINSLNTLVISFSLSLLYYRVSEHG